MVTFQGNSWGKGNPRGRWEGGIHIRTSEMAFGPHKSKKENTFHLESTINAYLIAPASKSKVKFMCLEGIRYVDPGGVNMMKKKGIKLMVIITIIYV